MKIIIKLDEVMLKRKIRLNELSDRIGITEANLSILKTGKAKAIRFSTLVALCKELECQPGDLLEFLNDEPTQTEQKE
jgi:putative transcriptional regulator